MRYVYFDRKRYTRIENSIALFGLLSPEELILYSTPFKMAENPQVYRPTVFARYFGRLFDIKRYTGIEDRISLFGLLYLLELR